MLTPDVFIMLLQVSIVPAVILLIKTLVPRLPKALLPILAPLVGAALEIVGYYSGLTGGSVVTGAVLGALGVWLREVLDQLKQVAQRATA